MGTFVAHPPVLVAKHTKSTDVPRTGSRPRTVKGTHRFVANATTSELTKEVARLDTTAKAVERLGAIPNRHYHHTQVTQPSPFRHALDGVVYMPVP